MRTVKKIFVVLIIIGITVLFGELAEMLNQPPNMVVALGNVAENTIDTSDHFREMRTAANSVSNQLEIQRQPPNCYVEVVPEDGSDNDVKWYWACDNGEGNISWKEAQERAGQTNTLATNINTKLYSWEYRSGNVLQFVDSTGGCSGSAYYAPDLSAFGWDNQVSSAEAIGNCGTVTIYEHTNSGGPSIACIPVCNKLFSLNNNGSSSYTQ